MSTPIITRFAPSPTGFLHVGGVRTALYSYLYAKQHKGTFILRIEDTDTVRSTKEFEQDIVDGLTWLGLTWDQFYRQSERTEIYKEHIQKLLDSGHAYISKETPTEPGGRSEVIRLKNPGTIVTWEDMILGAVTVDTSDLGDFVIAKDLDTPLFHLTVVVDDALMGITNIIRGQDHVSNTPRQILIQRALGFHEPQYAHIPLILAPDKTKLSKRHGAVSATEYRTQGYLKDALINFMALIGWNPGTEQELFSLKDLIEHFSIERVQKSAGVFNIEKLNWLNREYLKQFPIDELCDLFASYIPKDITTHSGWNEARFHAAAPQILERITVLKDITTLAEAGDLNYYFIAPKPTLEQIKHTQHLSHIINLLTPLKTFTADEIKNATWDFATEQGRAVVLAPWRIALTGKEKSPDPFTISAIIGKEETIQRLQYAVSLS